MPLHVNHFVPAKRLPNNRRTVTGQRLPASVLSAARLLVPSTLWTDFVSLPRRTVFSPNSLTCARAAALMETFATPYPLLFDDDSGGPPRQVGVVPVSSVLTFRRVQDLIAQKTNLPTSTLSIVFVCRRTVRGGRWANWWTTDRRDALAGEPSLAAPGHATPPVGSPGVALPPPRRARGRRDAVVAWEGSALRRPRRLEMWRRSSACP